MLKRTERHPDIYSEICPVSSAIIIGAGFIALLMGVSIATGTGIVLSGIALGIAGPVLKTVKERRIRNKQ